MTTPTDPPMLEVEDHPALDLGLFVARYPRALGELCSPEWLLDLLAPGAQAPLEPPDDAVRRAVRDLLRHGGFKPTGRNKPASEYLLRASAEGGLGAINPALDTCNAASLQSGLPISVVDLDLVTPPLRVAIALPGARYVFNKAGQEIDVGYLLCLHDAAGPCAGPVKDAQRTKTSGDTTRTLSLVWGTSELEYRTAATIEWYRQLVERTGASVDAASVLGRTPSPEDRGGA